MGGEILRGAVRRALAGRDYGHDPATAGHGAVRAWLDDISGRTRLSAGSVPVRDLVPGGTEIRAENG